MTLSGQRHIALEGICNLRDLGGYPLACGGSTGWRRVLRGDALHNLDDHGMAHLVAVGLSSVIDLRDASEIAHQPNPFSAHETVSYNHVPLFSHLDLRTHLNRIGAAGSGSGTGSVDILLALYCDVLTQRQPALAAALTAVADAAPGAVLFHCTIGKDRTGVLAALLLAVLGVPLESIVQDYAMSADNIGPIRDRMMAELTARGEDAAALLPLFAADPATMHGMFAYIDRRYGNLDNYFDLLDPERVLRPKLRARMLSCEDSEIKNLGMVADGHTESGYIAGEVAS